MPVIPFSSAPRIVDVGRETQEQRDAEDARRYREKSDAKLKELMETPVRRLDPKGGTSLVNPPARVTDGWQVNDPGVETPNPYLESGTPDMRGFVPDEGDPLWNQFEQDRIRKADPTERQDWAGGDSAMGTGGPERPVTGLSAEEIAELKKWRASRDAEQSDLKMRQTIGGLDRSPDEVARTIELSEKTGANRLEVQENLKTFEKSDVMSRVESLRQTAPKLRSWLDDPVNLEVAHDDADNLDWWGQTQQFFSTGDLSLERTGKAFEVGFGAQLQEALWGLDRMLGESNAAIYKALPDWVPGKFDLANEQVQRALTADMQASAWGKQKTAEMPVGKTWLERGVYGAASSAPSTVIAAIATVATRNPGIGAGMMGGTTAGTAYQEARESGKSFDDALRYGLTQGGIETATEFIPLKFLVGDLAKDTPFAKMFFRQAAAEGLSEQAATFLQDASTYIELNPDKTLAEFWAERPNAALETLVASTIMSGVQTTVAQGMQAAGDQIDQNAKQKRADEQARFIQALADNAKDSKLLKRLPQKYREAVAEITKDGPVENIRVQSEAFNELAQTTGKTVDELAQAFRINPEDVVSAIGSGEDVIIPSGNYAAAIQTAKKEIGVSGDTIHSAFAPNIRLRADGFTAKEQTAMKAVFEAEQEARAKAATTDQAFADSGDRVRDAIREQIAATGMYSTGTAGTQAEIVGSIVVTLAERTGQDPEALWKEQGFDIVASMAGETGDGGLSQSLPEDATPTQRLIDMRAKDMKNPEIAAALYPDVDPKVAVNRVKALATKHKAKIEERRATLEGAKALAQESTTGGTFTPREDRSIIRLFESRNLATLSHESAHWYLDTLWRMSKTENPHPFVLEQLASILEWQGKSPNWDAMFNPDGSFTKEGADIQEAFAETFEAYLRDGKAPTVGLRSVFASFKQWLLRAYKSVAAIGGRVKLNDEIRQVFDRMVASDEAIKAAQSNLTRDSEAMAKALLEKGVITEKQFDKTKERIAAARERAEAALMARLMDEYERSQKAWWNDEERQVRREVQSEIDERKEQRAFQVFTGTGWRDTREAAAEEAARQADAMLALAQEVQPSRQLDELGFYSAAQEAAQRVPDGIWQMGWQAARNSLAKGRDGVVPRKTEIEWLGLDAMFGDTKLKGAALKDAVLEHIDARRLELVQNFARFDPNAKAPTKAVMLDELSDYALSNVLDVRTIPFGDNKGRVITALLSRGGEFNTNLFIQALDGEVSDDPVNRYDMPVRRYQLYRGLDLAGKRELIATGLGADLRAKAARILVNENRARVLRNVTKEELEYHWEDERNESGGLVRGPGDIRLPGEDVPLFEMVIALPPGVPGSDYRAPMSHVGGKMQGTLVTAHGEERIDDKGQRTVFVGQVQSDMAQRAREIKEARRINKAVIERANINSREDAMEHLLTWHAMSRTREEFIAEWAPYPDSKMIDAARSDWAGRNGAEYIYNAGDTPDAPLISTSEWTNVAVRAMLYKAAREGFQSISFPTAETSEIIQGNDSAAMHYETNVKGALEKLAKQLGGEVRKGWVKVDEPGEPKLFAVFSPNDVLVNTFESREEAQQTAQNLGEDYTVYDGTDQPSAYILDITPAMRTKIVSEGFPLFHTRPGRPATTTPPPHITPMRLNLQAVKDTYGEKALAELPPEVVAHSMRGSDLEGWVQIALDTRKTLNKKRPKSLWKYLSTPRTIGGGNDRISYRGIRDTGGDIKKMIGDRKEAPGLIAKEGEDGKRSRAYDMDQAIIAATEAGYFSADNLPTIPEFLEALRADIDGSAPLYARDDVAAIDAAANAERWEAWFDQNEVDINAPIAELREKLTIIATSNGDQAIGPDEAAPIFGMRDGAELLEGLKQGPLRNKMIRDEVKRRMIERHGDLFSDGKIMEEAQAYARNEIQHRQFEIELDALAQAAGKPAASNLAKQTAIENLRSKQVREVLNFNQWLVLERRWAQKALEAAGKGDMDKAQEYARYRLINSHMYVEGRKLAERIEKTRKHLLAYDSKSKVTRLYAAGKDYAEQMSGLLSDYMLRNESRKGENKRASRAIWLQTQMAGIDPFAAYADPTLSAQEQQAKAAEAIERSALLARLAEGVEATNYKSVTVEELEAVRDEADLIWKLATLKDRLIKDGERRRLSLAAEDIAASVVANQPKERPPEPLESNLPGEKRKRSLSGFMVSHRTFQALARQFDGGKDGGVFWRFIVRPLNDAFAHKNTLMKQVGKDMEKLFSTFTSAELARFMRDRQTIDLGAGKRVTLTTQGRLAVALNAGNEKNLARLMDSNGWDRRQVQTIIDTLSKKEMDWVQATWDYLETWFPEANRVHEAVHAAPMDKQAPLQLATRYGVYRGGYFPIAFDPNRSSKAGQRKLEQDAQAAGGGRVGTRKEPGFAKKRVEGKVTLPLNLDPFSVILRHLDQVTTSIATEEVLLDVGRLIKHPDVENAVVERHGRVKYDEVIEAIKAAKFGLPVAQGSVEKILNHVRNGSTVAKLGWSVSTAMLQPSGISNSIVRIGFPWMMRGYGRMLGGAAQMEGWAKWAMERSEFMRNRRETQSPEQVNLLATLKGNKPLVMIQRSAFQLMAQVQFFSVDLATWYGAFDKATAGGADEALAVSMADQAVLDAQGGGEAFQTAGIQRGSVGVRLLTNLMSYMLTTYQLSVQSVAKSDPNLLTKITRISADMVLLWSVPVAATMAIRYAIQAAIGGDDDDEEYWSLENIAREQASFMMSPFFGLSQIAGAVKTDPYTYRGPAGLDMLVQTYKAADAASHGDVEQLLRPVNQMVGMAFHLPANQIDKTVRGSLALWNGETDSPLAIFFGPPRE